MSEDQSHIEVGPGAGSLDSVTLKKWMTQLHGRICQRVARKMPRFLARVVGTEDIVNEAYTKAFQSRHSFVPRGEDAAYRWLATIAMNHLRNCIRYHRLRDGGRVTNARPGESDAAATRLAYVPDDEPSPSRVLDRRERCETVKRAVEALPERHHQAVMFVVINQLPVKEAAKHMGCTERAVHGYLRRAKASLAMKLGSSHGFLSSFG